MTPKEEAKRLIEKFDKHANGYVGSSMLTDTEIPESRFEQAKSIAKDVIDEILYVDCRDMGEFEFDKHIEYYNEVLVEIDNLDFEAESKP